MDIEKLDLRRCSLAGKDATHDWKFERAVDDRWVRGPDEIICRRPC